MVLQRDRKFFNSQFIAERFIAQENRTPKAEKDPEKWLTQYTLGMATTLAKIETEEKHDAAMKDIEEALKDAQAKRVKRRHEEFEAAKIILEHEHEKKRKALEEQMQLLNQSHNVEIESTAKKFKIVTGK